jgi:hypothetical protein
MNSDNGHDCAAVMSGARRDLGHDLFSQIEICFKFISVKSDDPFVENVV